MENRALIAHWPLAGNSEDACKGHHGVQRNVLCTKGPGGKPNTAALFNGRDSLIEVTDASVLQLGCDEFSISAWIKCAKPMCGAFGDVLSKFDAGRHCGLNLWVSGGSASYSALSETRHIHAGIDEPGLPAANKRVSIISIHGRSTQAGVLRLRV